MTMQHDSDWRGYLQALPEAEPPAALWTRIEQARCTTRARDWRWPTLAAAILASVLVLGTVPREPAAPGIATAGSDPGVVDPAVQQLDLELSLAYARQAGEQEIAALWQTRERLLARSGEADPVLLARL